MTAYSEFIRACADAWFERNTIFGYMPKIDKKGNIYIVYSDGFIGDEIKYSQSAFLMNLVGYAKLTKQEVIFKLSQCKWMGGGKLTATQYNAVYRTIIALSPEMNKSDILSIIERD